MLGWLNWFGRVGTGAPISPASVEIGGRVCKLDGRGAGMGRVYVASLQRGSIELSTEEAGAFGLALRLRTGEVLEASRPILAVGSSKVLVLDTGSVLPSLIADEELEAFLSCSVESSCFLLCLVNRSGRTNS